MTKLDLYNKFFDSFDEFINNRNEEIKSRYFDMSLDDRLIVKRDWSMDMTEGYISKHGLDDNP